MPSGFPMVGILCMGGNTSGDENPCVRAVGQCACDFLM